MKRDINNFYQPPPPPLREQVVQNIKLLAQTLNPRPLHPQPLDLNTSNPEPVEPKTPDPNT